MMLNIDIGKLASDRVRISWLASSKRRTVCIQLSDHGTTALFHTEGSHGLHGT